MAALGDGEDNPPLTPTPYPGERSPTMRPDPTVRDEINREMVKHEAVRIAELLSSLERQLPLLATKEDVASVASTCAALDNGLIMLNQRIDDAESALMAKMDELASKVENLGHQGMSAMDIALKAEEIAKRAANGNGNGHSHSKTDDWSAAGSDEPTQPGLKVVRSDDS